jgi:hypothetical protein
VDGDFFICNFAGLIRYRYFPFDLFYINYFKDRFMKKLLAVIIFSGFAGSIVLAQNPQTVVVQPAQKPASTGP